METAVDSAIELIEPLLRTLGRDLLAREVTGVRLKGAMDVVTELDLMVEQRVTQFLSERFPDDSVLSEESASHIEYAERIWVLDPLDGTVNLANGIPLFAISLALLEAGTPVFGCIYDPVHDEMFSARRGQGAKLNGRSIQVARTHACTIALTTGVVRKLAKIDPEGLVTLLEKHAKLRGLGAQTLQLAYVASGRLGAAVSLETKLWDNAAGALIVEEAGGEYCDFARRSPFPVGPGNSALRGAANPCIAADPSLLDDIYSLLKGLSESAS